MRSTPKCEFVFTVKLVVWVTLCGSNLRGFTKGGFIYFCDKDRNICHKVWIILFSNEMNVCIVQNMRLHVIQVLGKNRNIDYKKNIVNR